MERSKFNVEKDTSKRMCNGVTFDSILEMKFYRDVLCPLWERGDLVEYALQKPYELQPKFVHDGRSVRAITYLADFYLKFENGREVVIDTKGCPDSVASLKRKMFWYCYPNLEYRWITYVKKFGGWLDYDEVKRLRRQAKQESKESKKNDNGSKSS